MMITMMVITVTLKIVISITMKKIIERYYDYYTQFWEDPDLSWVWSPTPLLLQGFDPPMINYEKLITSDYSQSYHKRNFNDNGD